MERPILFSTEMVRAILECRKTQTRRVMKPQPVWENGFWKWHGAAWSDNIKKVNPIPCHSMYNNAPYQPGDILWVRETWCKHTDIHDNAFEKPLIPGYYYKADAHKSWENDHEIVRWRPSIHMPREAARIFLKVTDVRVERLQDITETDKFDEGFEFGGFEDAWDDLYKEKGYGWDTNPWVWVIEFEKLKKRPKEMIKC